MLRSLFFSEREHSYQPVPSAEPAEQTVATAEHAEEIVVSAPWATLQLDLVMKIAGHLADSGDWKAIAALLLTNKRFYAILTDDSQYGNLTMPVTIDKQRHYLPMKNINHVVLANYFVSVSQHQQDVHNEVTGAEMTKANADSRCDNVNMAVGIVGCVAVHIGTTLLCDWVILPGIAKLLPGHCFPACCPGNMYKCAYMDSPACYSACCCPCCCGGDWQCQMACSNVTYFLTNLCTYNMAAIAPDIGGGWLLWFSGKKIGDYYDHKIQQKQTALAEVTELAPLSDPDKKMSSKIISTLFHINESICQHKNNRHQPPEVIRMEDVRTETVVPRRIKMN